jgi:hypothetical protein
MSTLYAEKGTYVLSDLIDGQDLPLDSTIDGPEYADLTRRIGLVEGEPGTPVSAFNSSI